MSRPGAPRRRVAVALVLGALVVTGCSASPESRFTSSTGLLAATFDAAAPQWTSPAGVDALVACPAGGDGSTPARPEPVGEARWTWPPSEPQPSRCQAPLDGKGPLRRWPISPLPRSGGLVMTGTATASDAGIVVDELVVHNLRPTTARLRTVRLEARDGRGVVARGATALAGIAPDDMHGGAHVPPASPDGTPGVLDVPAVTLAYTTATGPASGLTVTYEINSFDVMYRFASAAEAARYATADDVRAVAVGAELDVAPGPTRLGTAPGGEVCLTNQPLSSYQEAVQALSLPRPVPKRAPRFLEPEPVFLVAVELVRWPEWADIRKSGAVVPERPLDEIPSEWPRLDGATLDALADAWELCAMDLVGRVVAVERIPLASDDGASSPP